MREGGEKGEEAGIKLERREKERERTPETMNKRGQERKGDKGAKRLGARSKRKGVRVVWALFFHLSGPVLRGERSDRREWRGKKEEKKKKKIERKRTTASSECHPRISISARRDRGCVLISIGKTDLLDRPIGSRTIDDACARKTLGLSCKFYIFLYLLFQIISRLVQILIIGSPRNFSFQEKEKRKI